MIIKDDIYQVYPIIFQICDDYCQGMRRELGIRPKGKKRYQAEILKATSKDRFRISST
jgi:hypothetical protein